MLSLTENYPFFNGELRELLPEEEALCPVVVPALGSPKVHINSC